MLGAGRELDVLVCANIFHPPIDFDYKPQAGCIDCEVDTVNCHVPRYSTEIAAAWQVVEKLKAMLGGEVSFVLGWDGETWEAGLWQHDSWYLGGGGYGQAHGEADTATLAICVAALKAVGYEPKETL